MFKTKLSTHLLGAVVVSATYTGAVSATPLSAQEIQNLLDQHLTDGHGQYHTRSAGTGRPVYKREWSALLDGMAHGDDHDHSHSHSLDSHGFYGDEDGDDDDDDDDNSAQPQVVVLDFEVGSPTFAVTGAFGGAFDGLIFNDHVYTQVEKDEIQRRLEADYAGFNLSFTQEVPASGPFIFVQFNSNDNPGETGGIFPDSSILFGRADEIDFGNNNFNTGVIVDANLWEFLFQVDPTGTVVANNAGLNPADFATVEDMVSEAVVNQSANTGAHEIGHTLGLRHYDAFGAPGNGLPSTGLPAPEDFFPTYPGLQDATETVDHTMASGNSSGISLADGAGKDRFFSERSLVKLSLNDSVARGTAYVVSEAQAKRNLELEDEDLRNTLITGINAGVELEVESVVVEGRISDIGEVDHYRFEAEKGQLLSAEVISTVDIIDDIVFSKVQVFFEEANGSLTLVGENDDEFESFDAFLLDLVLPEDGYYLVQVESPDTVQFDVTGDGVDDTVPLTAFGPEVEFDLRVGNYSLHLYIIEADDD